MSSSLPSEPSFPGLNAYATLLTRPSYLAGALLLAHTLTQHSPTTPLLILYTPTTMTPASISALRTESTHSNIRLHPVEHLRLPPSENSSSSSGMVAERFTDTWTKLRVFEVLEVDGKKIERLCFLDADMMVFRDPSAYIFTREHDEYLSAGDGHRMCATHVCVCNLDHDAWAPSTWIPENCAHTHVSGPDGIAEVKASPETMGEMNTGTFSFAPSEGMRDFVLGAFESADAEELRAMKFPDQDFLNKVFRGRWMAMSWRTNALKTWRYWHKNMWRDGEVAVLHYIVDKPWAARVRVTEEGEKVAGYRGDDGETHSWWWEVYERWVEERRGMGEGELLETVGKYVAGREGEENEEMRAVGGGAQDFAKKWDKKEGGGEEGGKEDLGMGPNGPVLRKPMLGERGHGPVARERPAGMTAQPKLK